MYCYQCIASSIECAFSISDQKSDAVDQLDGKPTSMLRFAEPGGVTFYLPLLTETWYCRSRNTYILSCIQLLSCRPWGEAGVPAIANLDAQEIPPSLPPISDQKSDAVDRVEDKPTSMLRFAEQGGRLF